MRVALVAAAVAFSVIVIYMVVSMPFTSNDSRSTAKEAEDEWNPADYIGTAVESFYLGLRPYEVLCQNASSLMVKVVLGETRRVAIKFAFRDWSADELATMLCTARIMRSYPGKCLGDGAPTFAVQVMRAKSVGDAHPHYGTLSDSVHILGDPATTMDCVIELYPHLADRRAELRLGSSYSVSRCDPEATRIETETVRRLNVVFGDRLPMGYN